MRSLARFLRNTDPRLKIGAALALGPALWTVSPWWVAGLAGLLLVALVSLTATQPVERAMMRSLTWFVLFWVALKAVLDGISGLPFTDIVAAALILGLRLGALLLLGLTLAQSTSPRGLGMAVTWALGPFVGRERAWKTALSLALMIHFLPLCLSTIERIRESMTLRCPGCSLRQRLTLIPQAVLRSLGQKTWNQTLAVAGRRLDTAEAWSPEFSWSVGDTAFTAVCLLIGGLIVLA